MSDIDHRPNDVAVDSSPLSENPFRQFAWRSIPWAILLLALLLRHHQLSTVSAWFDESFEFRMVQFSPAEILSRSERDPQAPLHFFVLWVWHLAFGGTLKSLRYCSLLFGLLTVGGAYLWGTASASQEASSVKQRRIAGAFAALVIALSPVHIYWSQTVKTYSMGACFAVWSSWLLLSWFQHRNLWRLVLYVPVAAALTLQHHFGTFTVFAQLSFALCWRWPNLEERRTSPA